jgi:DNA-binding LytR/AlgR family response regulator
MSKIRKIEYGNKEMRIEWNHKICHLKYEDIMSISADRPYSVITTPDKKLYMETSLTQMDKNLPDIFFRCSRKEIVNLMYVILYSENEGKIYTNSGKVYNVSFRQRKYCTKRIEWLNEKEN